MEENRKYKGERNINSKLNAEWRFNILKYWVDLVSLSLLLLIYSITGGNSIIPVFVMKYKVISENIPVLNMLYHE
ncbi:MAG: hypothetical protein M1402_04165 [Candidatus Thermoplasmatota archaeon]|nr:hypothetical protein [Candidatus Thermoplasmatota archaeon]